MKESAIKNKKFAKYANQMSEYFSGWLDASSLSEEYFISLMKENCKISFIEEADKIECSFTYYDRIVGVPFVSASNSKLDRNNFKTDLFLLLLFIGNKIGGTSKDYIEEFVTNRQI